MTKSNQSNADVERPEEPYKSTQEILKFLGLRDRETLTSWVQKYRDFPYTRLPNGQLRFKISAIEKWLQQQAQDNQER